MQSPVRRWLYGLTVAGFACGAVCGWAAPHVVKALRGPEQDAYSGILRGFRETYRLSVDQERQIRMVLTQRDRAILKAYSSQRESLPKALRERVEEVRRKADERIEWGILDSGQRDQYRKDRLPASEAQPSDNRTSQKDRDR